MVLWVGRSSCKDPILGKLTLQEAEVFVFYEPQSAVGRRWGRRECVGPEPHAQPGGITEAEPLPVMGTHGARWG